MSDFDQESEAFSSSRMENSAQLSDDLPPVQPPSAAFIVQLFIFPAMIVMAVVAIWWMFGLIAAGEQDWGSLLKDLQSQNLQVRDRGMYGLAQVLDQDGRRGTQGQNLAGKPEIAQALSDQLILELRKNSSAEEEVSIQQYLTRSLGIIESLDVTGRALRMALEPERNPEIRKSALVSISFAAGRAFERGTPLHAPEMVEALIQASTDPTPVIQHAATFALGLFDSPESKGQLEVLLGSGDSKTRINAAIGFARHGSTRGYSVIRDAVQDPRLHVAESSSTNDGDRFQEVKNMLKAITDLVPKFDRAQRQELLPLVEALAANHPEIRIRLDAMVAANSLKTSINDAN